MTKKQLIKLGLGAFIQASEDTQFVDSDKITHKKLQKATIDIINKGTLRLPKPVLVIKDLIKSQSSYETYQMYEIPINISENYSEFNLKLPAYGQLGYFYLENSLANYEANDYLNSIKNYNPIKNSDDYILGADDEIVYARHAFSTSFSNSSILTGQSFTYDSTKNYRKNNTVYVGNSNFISGAAFKQSFAFRKWTTGNTNGIVSGNPSYSNFYLTYPNTVDTWSFNKYPIPLKLAASHLHLEGFKNLNGIITISTGTGVSSKICYISPHGLSTGKANCLVYVPVKQTGLYSNISYKRFPSGIIINSLFLGSQYFTGEVFPSTGIRSRFSGEHTSQFIESIFKTGCTNQTGFHASGLTIDNLESGLVNPVDCFGISGYYNYFAINSDQHLRQLTPIKDTLFYRFYKDIYTGSKNFNTGTWDGIIPKETLFTIEFITTEYNKDVGMYFPLYLLYTGFGTNDSKDRMITKYLSYQGFNESGRLYYGSSGLKQYVSIENNEFNVIGRGYGENLYTSLIESQKNARYNINQKIKKLSINYLSGIAIEQNLNRALKRVSKFKK